MNVLLLTIVPKQSQKMIRDIAYEFVNNGHMVFIVCPADKTNAPRNKFILIDGIRYLFVSSGNAVGKVNFAKKVTNFLLVDNIYEKALKRAMPAIDVDLILYSTPPITLANTIEWAKRQYKAATYLMLKDIFPQNAVDMGMMKKSGILGIVYHYFRAKEKKLYANSDYIGCMSPANCRYVLEHNTEIPTNKVGICVNSYVLEPVLQIDRDEVRERYDLPLDRITFLYGGNLGKPQGLQFFVDVLRKNINKKDRFFLICGGGNDQKRILDFIDMENPENVRYISTIPADEFDELSRACDVGLVFLDNRFTIPNFPSRMLSIMLNQMPILAATDKNTDVGEVIKAADMGWWCESKNPTEFCELVDDICENPDVINEKGKNARTYYEENYTSKIAYQQILCGLGKVKNDVK